MLNKIRIYSNGKPILDQKYPHHYHSLISMLKIGHNYSLDYADKKIKKISEYAELERLGWKITRREATGEFSTYQKYAYLLVPLNTKYTNYGRFPTGHHVKVDFANQLINLVGDFVSLKGESGWMDLKPVKKKKTYRVSSTPFDLNNITSNFDKSLNDNIPDFAQYSDKTIFKPIPEAIIGITDKGEICCLDIKYGDAPVIAIAGQRGSGKSIVENNLEGQFHHKLNSNIFNINDVKYDTQTRCLPWDSNHKFLNDLEIFDEPTIPLPYIYLHPMVKNIQKSQILYEEEVGFKISFPFKSFLLDTNLMKYNKQWEISPKSRKYIRNLIQDNSGNERANGLLFIKDLDEAEQIINYGGLIPDEMASLKSSIFSLVKDVWSRNILDVTSGIKSNWVAKINNNEYAYPPWDICLLCGIIPSFITAYARNHDWFPMWLKYILEDVFKFVKTDDYRNIQNKNLMLCGDEIVQLLREKETRNIIDQVIGEGRTDDIGFIQAVQHYGEIPDSILTNVTHQFVFNTKAKSTINSLKKEFALSKTFLEDMNKLKKFQCIAFGDFTLYNSEGERYSNNGEPVKIIKIKPPNAQHYGGVNKRGGVK